MTANAQKGSSPNGASFSLTDNATGQTIELPVITGSLGPSVIDVRALYGGTGNFTYDPGFTSTGACESKITYIDGDKGILLHRGYAIDELAENSDFLDVSYLLLYGELPTADQLEDFESRVTNHTMLHEQMQNFFRGFRTAFPDLEPEVVELHADDNGYVTMRYNVSGTHRGEFMGFAPTGRRFETSAMQMAKFNDEGKCVERWGVTDQLQILEQLGLIDVPA